MALDIEIGFLGLECLLLLLTLLTIIRAGLARLESATGILRDGLPAGQSAPAWTGPDLSGQRKQIPNQAKWQILVFADHSLAAFPSLAEGMDNLQVAAGEVEVLLISSDSVRLCEATRRVLELKVAIVRDTASLFRRFRVRVKPFAFVLDPIGTVRWVGLVNTKEQLVHMLRLARTTSPNTAPRRAGSGGVAWSQ